jgi:hypothetical protein
LIDVSKSLQARALAGPKLPSLKTKKHTANRTMCKDDT